jgi:nucleoside-diphosphate-sugar epimerase
MNRALVTGATGMLGSYIVERLVELGWSVRGLVRDEARAGDLAEVGAEPVAGCIGNADSILRAGAGCDVVFHTAAVIDSGGDWESFRRGNVAGTAEVVAAAEAARARLVHVSSTAVYGAARYRDAPTDESVALPVLSERDVYGRSKQEAERLVLEAHAKGRIWATVVRPPVMYGRRDRQFAPRIGPVMERGFFPLIEGGRTTLAIVHAASVAEGAILAATNDRAAGRVYLLTNDRPLTVEQLVRGAEVGLERTIWSPAVSARVGEAGFAALRWILRAGGRSDLARHARGTLDMLTRDNPFTSERALRELGWAPEPNHETRLADAFQWWKSNRAAAAGGG